MYEGDLGGGGGGGGEGVDIEELKASTGRWVVHTNRILFISFFFFLSSFLISYFEIFFEQSALAYFECTVYYAHFFISTYFSNHIIEDFIGELLTNLSIPLVEKKKKRNLTYLDLFLSLLYF